MYQKISWGLFTISGLKMKQENISIYIHSTSSGLNSVPDDFYVEVGLCSYVVPTFLLTFVCIYCYELNLKHVLLQKDKLVIIVKVLEQWQHGIWCHFTLTLIG